MIVTLTLRTQTVTLTVAALNTNNGGGSGVSVHNQLTGRDTADAHPQSAVTGLVAALAAKAASDHTHTGVYEPYGTTATHAADTDNPHSVTAFQVGADAAGTAATAVGALAATLGTAATHNVPASGNAASGEVVKGSDTRLDVAATVHAATEKTTPADDDEFGLIDSAASWVLKRLKWSSIKTALNSLYQTVLVSGTNIKTVNSTSLLGSGDIVISGLTGFTAAESTSSPNATVPVASLTANNAATNVDAALRPKGTGAVLAQVPDSTTTGGNKRGAGAVDWQLIRTGAAQVASGAQAAIPGGYGNTASGAQSFAMGLGSTASAPYSFALGYLCSATSTGAIAGGQSNTASGSWSTVFGLLNAASGTRGWIPGGTQATDRGISAAGAYAGSQRAAAGDRQTMVLPISCAARTDATATVMTSDAGAASTTNQMVLPNNSSMFFEVDVVAHDSTLKSASWKVQGTIRRGANAAATAIVGTNVTTTFGSDLSGGSPGVTCTADTTNGALQVTFTGIAATTIYPSGHIRTVIAA